MKPIRRNKKYRVTHDPATGKDRILGSTQEEHVVSDEASIDSTFIEREYFLDCGCNASPAGRCYQCGSQSCERHFGICDKCQKPLCNECSIFIDEDGQRNRYCKSCHEENKRNKVKRFFLSFLLETKD